MTYQVYVVDNDGKRYPLGEPVRSFTEADELVEQLDSDYIMWEEGGFQPLNDGNILLHYEGCDIELVSSDGQTWELDDCDKWIKWGTL